jgi:hypothetical protein
MTLEAITERCLEKCVEALEQPTDGDQVVAMQAAIMGAVEEAIAQERNRTCELADIGRKWRKDNSLEKWFPITAQWLATLEAEHYRTCEWEQDGGDEDLFHTQCGFVFLDKNIGNYCLECRGKIAVKEKGKE